MQPEMGKLLAAVLLLAAAGWTACDTSESLIDGAETLVLGATTSAGSPDTTGADTDTSGGADAAAASTTANEFAIVDTLFGEGEHQIFVVDASRAGDEWTVEPRVRGADPIVVALFDRDQNLLARQFVTNATPLRHVARDDTALLYVGVAAPATSGAELDLRVTRGPDHVVPPPQSQTVYLNFDGGSDVSVHNSAPATFGPLDAAAIDARYAGATAELRDAIIASMREDYAGYAVTLVTSTAGLQPGTYSTLHFGALSQSLLGLADSVDEYNQQLSEQAIIYVESFGVYVNMDLSTEEMGVMVANVASHELGHLLGLYHTQDPDDLMDTTGSAWDLAGVQTFSRAPLEPSVFPAGMEDSARMLERGVGLASAATAKSAAQSKRIQTPLKNALRRLARQDLRSACGTCIHLDD